MNPSRVATNIEYQMPTHGRIRLGQKNTKGYPESLKCFRFTSSDSAAIESIAAEYGGTVRPWMNGKKPEFEVVTERSSIDVTLPPNALDGPIWEYWLKSGKLFDCDGVECIKTVQGPEGPEWERLPCQCKENDKVVCKPMTRLSVLLHNVPLGGCWLMSTGSISAASELPQMVEVVRMMYDRTLVPARLVIEPRMSTSGKQTKHYTVPVLRSGATLIQLQSQQEAIAELNEAPVNELGSGG